MQAVGVFFGVIVALAVIIIGYFISTQRSLVSLDEMCKNALSQIEVQLNSRFDAVVALAKTAAQYAKHESETIIQTIEARGGHTSAATPAGINAQSDLLGQMMSRLNVVVEQYPELKASELYQNAQAGQAEYEENVRMSRMVYNDTATKMNRMVRQWPSSIVAQMLHFDVKDYLKVDNEKKKDYPDLDEAFKK
ncbi:LemA family protein [Xylanibacter ruminicola]|jgi:LemA protein|uniref:LemA family protein n=2 Tax=Xylanibacter ruminicola TaxID=839 RepID=D5EWI9_XYLR2|nr:LemA family protein [Xylanibacter ruminicola]ADE81909.1 LemA family protein [Xylanibacter ruminicola 23]SEH87036.1 LemA protein [Xylanibacter ruminicola]